MGCSGNSYTPSPAGIDGLLWEVLSRVGVISVWVLSLEVPGKLYQVV